MSLLVDDHAGVAILARSRDYYHCRPNGLQPIHTVLYNVNNQIGQDRTEHAAA